MEKIDIKKAIEIAKKKNLKPGLVDGTDDAIQFTKGKNKRIKPMEWDEFEKIMKEKKLAVYESKGWMKIMKK